MVISGNSKLHHKMALHDTTGALDYGLEVVEESPECNARLLVRSPSDDPDGVKSTL
jgi:hypothetical protein